MKVAKNLDYQNSDTSSVEPEPLELDLGDTELHHRPAASRPRRANRTLIVVAVLIAAIGAVFLWRWKAARTHAVESPPNASVPLSDVVVPDQAQLKQISVDLVGEQTVTTDRDATGKVSFNEDRLTPVFTPYAGRVVETLASKGAEVERGRPLLVLESPELISAQNDLTSARSELSKAKIALDVARASAERARRLYEREAIASKDLQLAEADFARATDEYHRAQDSLAAVENRLALFGKEPQEIAQLGGRVDRRVVIRAPIAGTIVERKVGPGQYVKPDSPDPLFLISDLSTLWVLADVYESDLAGIHFNAPAEITVAAYPHHTFPAHISFISPTVDPSTRTVRVRCLVENSDRLLKPDMFAKIKINSAMQRLVPTVSANAIVSQGDDSLVFVEESPGRFRRRQVRIGREVGGQVTIEEGLRPAERVAARGALLLNQLIKSKG